MADDTNTAPIVDAPASTVDTSAPAATVAPAATSDTSAPAATVAPAAASIDPKTAFLALSLDGQASALFDHLAAVANALGNIQASISAEDGLAARVAALETAPAPVASIPAEIESAVADVTRLVRHVFGA
jgi:hypothetical protein